MYEEINWLQQPAKKKKKTKINTIDFKGVWKLWNIKLKKSFQKLPKNENIAEDGKRGRKRKRGKEIDRETEREK